MDTQLTISIVNWNVREYLEKCLESIFKYSGGIKLEVIVIDNASRDGSMDMVRKKFPQAAVIENNRNLGYGPAHNQAIKIARGKYILFLNPDTEVMPGTLPNILKFMDIHPEAAACQCAAFRNKKDIEEFLILTGFDKFLYFFSKTIHKKFPNTATARFCMNIVAKALMQSRNNLSTNFISIKRTNLEGAFLLARMDALKLTNGFDPRHHHGGEGAHLTWDMYKAGWKLYYVLSVRIVHYKSKSFEQISDSDWAKLENEWQRHHE